MDAASKFYLEYYEYSEELIEKLTNISDEELEKLYEEHPHKLLKVN